MLHRSFSGVTLVALGAIALLQSLGYYNFGLTLWPAVALYIGLEIVYGSLFDRWHSPSAVGAFIGALVSGWGVMQILANLGLASALSVREWLGLAWPLLLVAIGLSVLFGRKRWHVC